jgi:hypothetical protein
VHRGLSVRTIPGLPGGTKESHKNLSEYPVSGSCAELELLECEARVLTDTLQCLVVQFHLALQVNKLTDSFTSFSFTQLLRQRQN